MRTQENVQGLIDLYETPRSLREHTLGKKAVKFAREVVNFYADAAANIYTALQKQPEIDRSMYHEPEESTGDVRKVGPQKVRKHLSREVGKIITPDPEVWTQKNDSGVYDWKNDPAAAAELNEVSAAPKRIQLDMDEATPADVSFKADISSVSYIQGQSLNDLSPSERQIIEASL